jgi:hypothetical protein
MSEPSDQWIDAVAKLTELTQNGKLKWNADEYVKAPGSISPAYFATYKGRSLRLQKRRVSDEPTFFGRSEVRDQYVLEFLGAEGNSLWTFPEIDAIEDLFAAVQYQTAGVKEFLNDLLSHNPE